METIMSVVYWATMFWLLAFSAQDVQEQAFEITTESFDFSSLETTEAATESPDDNGMVIGDISENVKSNGPISAAEAKEEEPSAVEERPVVVSFPNNHKNFTSQKYLRDQEFPSYYDYLNPYQQQYKNYFEQKQIYNRKPIKFEENSHKNFYVPSGGSLDFVNEIKNEDTRINRKPFPYVFENERDHDQTKWHKSTGHVLVHEQPAYEHAFRGYQENVLPHYVFPHSYPQKEEKFHKNEFVHFDYRHVKKNEKENPWKKVFHVLTALIPLGLLLATLTPNVISINSTATTKTTRQRSEDSSSPLRFKEEDVLKLMKKYGMNSLSEGQCEDKIICELAREGGKNSAGPIEKGFWFLANKTPWEVAEKAGMNELFKAIRTGNCGVYKCHSTNKSNLGKKLIRKHKKTA